MHKSNIILIAALLVYSISAIFNNGFYYFDEHYQLIEFAELKTGNNRQSDLAWEYNDEIRSTVQPALAFSYLSLMREIGISDHYLLMIILRFVTSILAILIITIFVKKTDFLLKKEFRLPYQAVSYFLWFLPFINIRFSSESYSGLIFLLSIITYYSSYRSKFLWIGILLGLSFLFRFQTAFMSLGFFLWLMFVEKPGFKNLLKIIVGGTIMLSIGVVIDWWFYGEFTITFVNYFSANVIDNVASNYGVSPWYYYFTQATQYAILPFGALIWISLFTQIAINKTSWLIWVIVPFLLAHILTPHKEVRFLFPIINFIPLITLLTAQKCTGILKLEITNGVYKSLLPILIIVNVFALIVIMFSPADDLGRINVTQKIHHLYKNEQVVLWAFDNDNPYKPITPNQNFYRDTNVHFRPWNLDSISKSSTKMVNLIVIRNDRIENNRYLLRPLSLKEVPTGSFKWVIDLKKIAGYKDKSLRLFELTRKPHLQKYSY